MVSRGWCVTMAVLLFPLTAAGQAFVLSDAHYSYLHSPWFQVDGCNFKTGCAFGLSGVVGVTVDGGLVRTGASLGWAVNVVGRLVKVG